MELLDLPQLAERSGLPLSLTRYYRDRFILFVPSVRLGRTILHPVEAVDVMAAIREYAASGLSADAIQAALEQSFPVTVINSQELPGADAGTGSINVIRALAAAIDERGARLESEVLKLREQVAGTATANQLQAVVYESHLASTATNAETGAELQRLRAAVEELRAHVTLLASREQLEWIGDVVAAAALRPPQGAMDVAVERRLLDLQEAILQTRDSGEVAELRAAIERLTQHVGNRDQEIHKAFQMLIGALRQEIAAVQTKLADLKAAIRMDQSTRIDNLAYAAVHTNGNGHHHGVESSGMDLSAGLDGDRGKPRPPRRLGQPLRAGGLNGEHESFHGAD